METRKNYRVLLLIDNFETDSVELDFNDFTIKRIKPGTEAAVWRSRMHSKRVPEYVLIKDFPDYVSEKNDLSGFDGIMNDIMNLLRVFRLFKLGDLFFNDMMIEDQDTHDRFNSLYRMDNLSVFKYVLEDQYVQRFLDFRNRMIPKINSRSKFINYCLGRYMSGADREFSFRKESLYRIIDYVIALESVFLIDGTHLFLRRTLANRVSRFLDNSESSRIVKFMYDERSNIVHGNYINLDEKAEKKLQGKLKEFMPGFESIMKMTLIKLLDLQFDTKEEIEKYMKNLYDLPPEAIDIMNAAKAKAEEYLRN